MNQSDLAIIYKKGATDKPDNYRPIALLSLSYKGLAKMIQVRFCNGFDDHLDNQQFGFRKAKATSQPFIYIQNNIGNTRGSRTRNVHTPIRLGKCIG